jgi:hypothetical protein
MDSLPVQQMGALYLLYPSLLLTLVLLLPMSAACNWLKANLRFSSWQEAGSVLSRQLARGGSSTRRLLLSTLRMPPVSGGGVTL